MISGPLSQLRLKDRSSARGTLDIWIRQDINDALSLPESDVMKSYCIQGESCFSNSRLSCDWLYFLSPRRNELHTHSMQRTSVQLLSALQWNNHQKPFPSDSSFPENLPGICCISTTEQVWTDFGIVLSERDFWEDIVATLSCALVI
jgi:hypothetical protein